MNTTTNCYLAEVHLKSSNPAGHSEIRRFPAGQFDVARDWCIDRAAQPDSNGHAEICFVHGRNGKTDTTWQIPFKTKE